MKRTDFLVMIILAGLSFTICFAVSSPSLYLNDEWITTNQLNQIFSGSQLIENEGKYGRLFTGESSAYFTTRNNYLAYSLMLPILSVPSLSVIATTNNYFRLFYLFLWFVICSGSLLAGLYLASQWKYRKIKILLLIFLIGFFSFFFVNLYYYQPFETQWEDSPVESAAVTITNAFLFSCIAPMLYGTFRSLGMTRGISLIGIFSVTACSSYLYWAGSAKDHLLVAFLITALFFIFALHLSAPSPAKYFSLFFVAGLICWARLEYGAFIVIGLLIWHTGIFIYNKKTQISSILSLLGDNYTRVGFFGLIGGLIPFFLNNVLITGNPFIPPQYLYIVSSRAPEYIPLSTLDQQNGNILTSVYSYAGQMISFYSPGTDNLVTDLFQLFINPPNGGIGILLICPIVFPALLFVLCHRAIFSQIYSQNIKRMMLFSIFIIILTFMAYLRVLHGSLTSIASVPDMRYYSPIYVPLGILSFLLISPVLSNSKKNWLFYSIASIFIISPLIVLMFSMITSTFSIRIYLTVMIYFLLIVYLILAGMSACWKGFWYSNRMFPLIFASLLFIPASIQFMIILFYSHVKMNGYPFWLPVLEYLFTNVLHIIY